MGRPRLHDEHLRQRLLEAATDLMAVDGPDFSLRPLVASVGTSTSAVYSLFGSRGELLEAITLRAARSFVDAQEAARVDDPAQHISGLAHAIRAWAKEHAAMFQVVFGRSADSPAVGEARDSTTEPLLRAVTEATEAGVLHGDPVVATGTIFAGVHGFITLELLGLYPADQADALFDAQLAAIWRSWATPEHVSAVA
ncbi:TetR/AcrR family transcriptional regulator [Agrococcus sediminis]|uniref:TetR/AcrR family transcriptional regulator n=1 Tax=Agrococcus sediminis TaxID=2599924 RepID=A0A5M8Q820_9MICO|nr:MULTISPECIES: TetR/AcrR family transcriptional regulator [Agrococcus]KAA6432105.1 TetR/AcrR family transcriptional regulator [Agrococcus sediminis]MDR7233006.1 AcrR family transcriptional regulator [Agrococcus sp. BE272]RWR25078.1 TetR/AcrR family transcriptional regulator [Agrococcus lahaulensis]UOW00014.1 TetR/AcrR family transcriptional regulator [Agrococcus sp. SCSIO52902]